MTMTIGSMTLWDYQEDSHDAIFHALDNGMSRALVQLPTGCGKTILMAAVAHTAIHERGWPVMLIAHRNELLGQAGEKFARMGLDTVLEKGTARAREQLGHFLGSAASREIVVLGSEQTLKGDRLASWPQERFGLIMWDEAHHIVSPRARAILNYFQGYRLLGVTATAQRGDKISLGKVFNESTRPVYEFRLQDAIELQYLAPLEIRRIFTGIEVKKLRKTTEGDLNMEDIAEAISPEVNRLCKIILKENGERKAILFAPNVALAEAFASCLCGYHKKARSVSGKDSDEYRASAITDFAQGHIQYLCNCGIFTEGYDEPSIETVILLRPTMSRVLFSQMVGRGTRHWPPKKTHCLILDMVLNTENHDLKQVHPVELFINSDSDDDVMEIAAGLIDKGQITDISKALKEADFIHRENKRLKVKKMEVDTLKYKVVSYDPMGLCQVGMINYRKSDFDGAWRATPEQIENLRKFKIQNPETLTRTGAQRRLNMLYSRRKAGLATVPQVIQMVKNGIDEKSARSMTFEKASKQLDLIFGKR